MEIYVLEANPGLSDAKPSNKKAQRKAKVSNAVKYDL